MSNSERESDSEPDSSPTDPNVTLSVSSTNKASSQSTSKEIKNDFIKDIHRNGRHYIRCEACFRYPEVVKLYAPKGRIPAIALEDGARFRLETLNDHAKQTYHTEAAKALRLNSISTTKSLLSSPIGIAVSKANESLAKKIGGLMTHVFNDAKRLTLTPHSFPSRMVAEILSKNFDMVGVQKTLNTNELQYLNPTAYRDFLTCIVESDRDSFCERLVNSSGISLRCDGSVDRTQVDKIFVMAKVVRDRGAEELYFLGVDECPKRGAEGLLMAVQSACTNTIGGAAFEKVLLKTSSFVTDGTDCNTGERGGLWAKV